MIYGTTSAYCTGRSWGDVVIYHCTCAYRKTFFPRSKNRDNRGADLKNFLQLRNFADPRKTVIPDTNAISSAVLDLTLGR